jgi:hypothetical protein
MPPPRNNPRLASVGTCKKAPLCDQVPLLSVLDLARRDAQRRPLVLPDEASLDNTEERRRLEATRRHLEQERCPVCRRWYRNALEAYGMPLEEDPSPDDG